MTNVASKEERDKRLDALVTNTKEWAKRQRKNLNYQVALCKRILEGRKGANKMAKESVELVSDLVVDEINTFMTGK